MRVPQLWLRLGVLWQLLWLALPAWARLGGGSGYRSSRSSSSSSSGSSHSYSSGSHSYSSSSHSSGGSYHGSGTPLTGGDLWIVLLIIVVAVLVLLYLQHQQNGSEGSGGSGLGWLGCTGGVIALVIVLTHPFLVGMVALGVYWLYRQQGDGQAWLRGASQGGAGLLALLAGFRMDSSESTGTQSAQPSGRLEPLLAQDPNFSLPVFREFAVLLYCQAITERVDGQFPQSRPYLSSRMIKQLSGRASGITEVADVVVGCCQLVNVRVAGDKLVLRVSYESNYIERGERERAFVSNEVWTFERRLGVLSKPPSQVSRLCCPGCGYAGDMPTSGICPQCDRTNQTGEFDWVATGLQMNSLDEFVPYSGEGASDEAGTSGRTLVHFELGHRREEFMARHPDFSWPAFNELVEGIFRKLQQAWSERDPAAARPHETDVLFRTHRYWIEDYRRRGRINRLSDINFQRAELSNIVVDAFYESITVRIFAAMVDVTTDESGRLLFGNPNRARPFTEYWTFIRRIGNRARQGDPLHNCPACGAPLDRVNQSGVCEYCESVVTLGDFDWVLSNIEQDEVYQITC